MRLQRAITRSGRTHAEESWLRLELIVDDYAREWTELHAEVCTATHVRHERNEQRMDAHMRCLDDRAQHLRALVDTLAEGSEGSELEAVQAAMKLPSVARCGDPAYVDARGSVPTDPAIREELTAVESQLARVKALRATGRPSEALELAIEAATRVERLGHAPTHAEALMLVGSLHDDMGDYPQAAQWLERAYFEAERSERLEISTEAAIELSFVLGIRRDRASEAMRWSRHAEAAADKANDEPLRARLVSNQGQLHWKAGRLDEAIQSHQEALAIQQRVLGPGDPALSSTFARIGNDHEHAGHYPQALEAYRQALAIDEQALGPHHPRLATTLGNIANVHTAQGHYDDALRGMKRSLKIYEHAYEPDHPHIARTLGNIGTVHFFRHEYDEATPLLERALAIYERTLGPLDPKIALVLNNLTNIYQVKAQYERALPLYRRVLAIQKQQEQPNPAALASTWTNIGNVLGELEQPESAIEAYNQAVELFEGSLGPDHPSVAYPLVGLGQLHIARGEALIGFDMLERSLVLRERADVAAELLAFTRFELAKAIIAADRDRPRARHLAQQSRAGYAAAAGDYEKELASVDAWLADLGE